MTDKEKEIFADFIGKRKWNKDQLKDRKQQWDLPMCEGYYPTVETMHFHDQYNWIMPVVEKIESLGYDFIIDKGNRVEVNGNGYNWNGGYTSEPKITCIRWGALIFIRWYNSQPTTKG